MNTCLLVVMVGLPLFVNIKVFQFLETLSLIENSYFLDKQSYLNLKKKILVGPVQ